MGLYLSYCRADRGQWVKEAECLLLVDQAAMVTRLAMYVHTCLYFTFGSYIHAGLVVINLKLLLCSVSHCMQTVSTEHDKL